MNKISQVSGLVSTLIKGTTSTKQAVEPADCRLHNRQRVKTPDKRLRLIMELMLLYGYWSSHPWNPLLFKPK
jgi:hypothetical protein